MTPNHSDSLIHNSTEKRASLPSVLGALPAGVQSARAV
jgi:hypothetical protein